MTSVTVVQCSSAFANIYKSTSTDDQCVKVQMNLNAGN